MRRGAIILVNPILSRWAFGGGFRRVPIIDSGAPRKRSFGATACDFPFDICSLLKMCQLRQ